MICVLSSKNTDVWEARTASIMAMEAVRASKTSVYFKKNSRSCMPEGCNLHTGVREKLNFTIHNRVVTYNNPLEPNGNYTYQLL